MLTLERLIEQRAQQELTLKMIKNGADLETVARLTEQPIADIKKILLKERQEEAA